MRLSKEKGLYLAFYFLTISSSFQVYGKHSKSSKHKTHFIEGVPDNPSEAADLLEKLLPVLPFSLRPANSPNFPGSSPYFVSYPLDPLTALEIRAAALIIRATNKTISLQFKCIGLREPEKSLLYPYYLSGTNPPVGSIDRKADVLVVNPASQAPAWVVVNLSTLKMESWVDARPDQHSPYITGHDIDLASDIALADAGVIQRIDALGINDMSTIVPDVWEAGYVADNPTYAASRKLLQVFFYVWLGGNDNFYAHPLDFVAYVDIGAQTVRGIEDLPIQVNFDRSNRTGNSVPLGNGNIFLGPDEIRNDVRPIAISRPEGVSFQVQDRLVSWQNFQFRVGYNPREGLVINQVTYNDNGNLRPLFYRLSLSESYVYYGDPRPPYHRKDSYDEGSFEFGSSSISLSSEFCRGQAYFYDSVIHNDRAETSIVSNSTCIFEEDTGILWASYDFESGRTAVTRSQRLSISSFIVVGNNNYLLSWRFYQDATVELNVRITGTMTNNLMAIDVKAPPYGNLMGPQLYAQNFQYFIGARIDADIDGIQNTVSVEDIVSVPKPDNPYGNGIETQSKIFKYVGDAPSDIQSGRYWRIANPSEVHPITGKQISWKLIPGGYYMPSLITPDSPLKKMRLQWADHNMWVLPYNEDQLFIDNTYLDCGVSKWTNESLEVNIENSDVVLWHVFSFANIPDPEDWPVLSLFHDGVGFKLRPSNFFVQNPAVTVPLASQTTAYDDQTGWTAPQSSPSPGWRK